MMEYGRTEPALFKPFVIYYKPSTFSIFKDPIKIIIWAPLCVKFIYIVSNTKAFLAQLFSKLYSLISFCLSSVSIPASIHCPILSPSS